MHQPPAPPAFQRGDRSAEHALLGHVTYLLFTLTINKRNENVITFATNRNFLPSCDNAASPYPHHEMVEVNGIEPMTSCLQSRRSPN